MNSLADTKQNKKHKSSQAIAKNRQAEVFKRPLKDFFSDPPTSQNSAFQHDFSRVQTQSPLPELPLTRQTSACPLSPRSCPSDGTCHTCPARVQTKLTINQPGDRYEREADRIAEQIIRMPNSDSAPNKAAKLGTSENLQRLATTQTALPVIPPVVYQALSSDGYPLQATTRALMEALFDHDFGSVRVHTNAQAGRSARALNARAYAVGQNIVFGTGQYNPQTANGQQLLTHELAHVVQQRGADSHHIQRQGREGTSVTVRSPVLEETVTQASAVASGLAGRGLTQAERNLARPIFGRSLDLSRVRLISSNTLSYRTVGNAIYVPNDFTIRNANMTQTLIHELTHVWQYQHSGTSYISVSLGAQISAAISRGSRNFAYAYTIQPDQSFFDFNPEQQGSIVEHYFAMLRDQREIPRHRAAGVTRTYASNHLDAKGFSRRLSAARRLAEISRELPQHQRLIRQMQAALPRPEIDVLQLRTRDLMQTPGRAILPEQEERQLVPIRSFLEVRFRGL